MLLFGGFKTNPFNQDVYLSNVDLTIADISFETTIELLAPNASVAISVPASIGGDLEAVAHVTAKPTLEDHSEIPGLEDVTDTDSATVKAIAHEPHISVVNNVYVNPNGEVKCGSNETLKTAEGYKGSPVSFCFEGKIAHSLKLSLTNEWWKVINSGDSFLKDIVLTNTELHFSESIESLSPGQSKMIVYHSTIGLGGSNLIEVSAVPSTKSGKAIYDSMAVTASDSSSVMVKEYDPSLVVDNVVYKGHLGTDTCNTTHARELAEGFSGSDVTYCFVLKNEGDTALKSLRISNEALGYSKILDEVLESGETRTIVVERAIDADLKNFVVVEATAVHPSSHDKLENHSSPINASDSSMVLVVPLAAGIKVSNLVFVGDGDHCGTDKALGSVKDLYGSDVTYCLEVRNTGDTSLGEISLVNDVLSYKKTDFGLLSPGQSVSVEIPAKLLGDSSNTARVEAIPVTEKGAVMPDMAMVSSEASSFTEELLPSARIRIESSIYKGEESVDGCKNTSNSTSGLYGSSIVYCLKGKVCLNPAFLSNRSCRSHQ